MRRGAQTEANVATITEIYRWHASEKKYMPDDDALEKFEQENMERT